MSSTVDLSKYSYDAMYTRVMHVEDPAPIVPPEPDVHEDEYNVGTIGIVEIPVRKQYSPKYNRGNRWL